MSNSLPDMNNEHGDHCLPCKKCKDENGAMAYSTGQKHGTDHAIQKMIGRVHQMAANAFIANKDTEARMLRDLAGDIAKVVRS